MLILLPPSEGKSPASGPGCLDLDALCFIKQLKASRLSVIKKYGVEILDQPTAPAIDIYSGVLYQALGYHTLTKRAQQRAQSQLLIFSALFGVLRPLDRIPLYRMKITSSDWKDSLALALDSLEKELIVDCRSSTYINAWKSDPQITVAVRVFQEIDGVRSVNTHMSKKYRGELVRILLQGRAPKSPHELRDIAAKYFQMELREPAGNAPWQLDLIILG
ncbi:MAG: peroxide stress protein YaaA [Actinomycetes bacterium]